MVSEEEITRGINYLLDEHSILAEGSGVVGISALLENKELGCGDKLVVVVSGRNIDRGQLLEVARS